MVTVHRRADDFYISLVSELFDQLRLASPDAADCARLGNAFSQFCAAESIFNANSIGISRFEASLFSSCAFYFGGYPASAYLVQREFTPADVLTEHESRCRDLLLRPIQLSSETCSGLINALRTGDMQHLGRVEEDAKAEAARALRSSPEEWITAVLFEKLLERFSQTNIRAVLPNGQDAAWAPLIESFIDRQPPTWDYFPSQIEAIQAGLLTRSEPFALQMPTGAGKTTLCETLLYSHAIGSEETVAVLLVPYRALASELKGSLVKRLNALGVPARAAYGGTIPASDELHDLNAVRVLVATPEALSGTLSAEPEFFNRIALVICDEGHLLDNGDRGIGLELLLARMRARPTGPPRLVFVSAIVPNIEEINAWLGGTPTSVVRSDYKPAIAEYAVLRPEGGKNPQSVSLEMHPHLTVPDRYTISSFLKRDDFKWIRPETGRSNAYSFGSVKTQAIATARKVLSMGAAAVFAAQKRGNQGAIGLAEELQTQIQRGIARPDPRSYSNPDSVPPAVQYLGAEFGDAWIGTQTLANGAILHHGDIPQETREVLEQLLRSGALKLAICTSTLAEGVNLPIRSLVLYSVERRTGAGAAEPLLARDIKNLVGRAGRPGASTKGLVICANPQQWSIVRDVARQAPGEPVTGELRRLVERVRESLAFEGGATNAALEGRPELHSLIDGIDSTLIDLATEELGEDQLVAIATQLADTTFAAQQAQLESSKALLRTIFELRARRIVAARTNQRLAWIRETGARLRFLEAVEGDLAGRRERWDDVESPTDASVVRALAEWAWQRPEMLAAVQVSLRLPNTPSDEHKQQFLTLLETWLSGARYKDIALACDLDVNTLLGLHTHALSFVFHSLAEQGIALLDRVVASNGTGLSKGVAAFPDHVRFGVPTTAALILARKVRHRLAAVQLGSEIRVEAPFTIDDIDVPLFARGLLLNDPDAWRTRLGELVYANTSRDLAD
jgi:hypothetical protein